MRAFHTLSLSIACAAALSGQDLVPKAAPQRAPVLLHNGVIHTVAGPTLPRGGVLFDKGRIVAVEADAGRIRRPAGTVEVDLKGSHVYPGLVTANTSLGLIEVGNVRMTDDTAEVGDITPEVRANIAVNPDSTAIPVARSNGILTAGVFPSGGLVCGRASAMSTDGWTWRDMTLVDDVGLVIRWPRASGDARDEQVRRLDELLAKARAWVAARAADPTVETDVRLQALAPVLARKTKVFVHADDLDSITGAVEWAVRNELDPVIVGGRDAVLCADLLKRHEVEVVLSGTHQLPKRRDSHYDERFILPKEVHEAGLKWCLGSGGSFSNERNLPYHAASAVAFGLPEDEAIRAITLYPARTLGIDGRVGSIRAGLDATLIVTNGSPLDLTTAIEVAFVQGRQVDLHNKQRALAEKYRAKYRQLGRGR